MNFIDYLFEHSQTLTTPFLLEGGREYTHADIHERVKRLAAFIQSQYGTTKEMLLVAENSLFFIVSYLAIIESGNIVLLLETRVPDTEIAQIRKNCSLRAYFVQKRYAAKFQDAVPHLYTEKNLEELPEPDNSYPFKTDGDDVAAIVFTSGSSGAKKGVMLTHCNLIANTESILQYLSLSGTDRTCVILPFHYCYGASLLHTHLRVGGSIVLSKFIFPTQFIRDLKSYRCSGFSGVPSTFQILINKTTFLKENFPELRYMAQAGGHLPRPYIEKILDAFPAIGFFVMYGATEATARLSYLPPELARRKMGSIGKGIPGVTLRVIDNDGVPVSPGETGEIIARGKNIMKGYYKDREATSQAIREGWLYTGDLATVDEEGFIYIVGRSKNIIKSAGYRISPLEIEDFISSLPHVLGCVVIGIPDEIMGEAPAAVIQTDVKDNDSLTGTIRDACTQKFPCHKIPKIIEFIDEFPLNSSQKVDQNLLRERILRKKHA